MIVKLVHFTLQILFALFPWLRADYRRRIKPRCKCPACGAVKLHKIQFDPNEKLVVLTCSVCACEWGYAPLVKPDKYVKPPKEEEQP